MAAPVNPLAKGGVRGHYWGNQGDPMKLFTLSILMLAALAGGACAGDHDFEIRPEFDLRVRQEVLDGVYHFAPETNRNWLRFRTRAGAAATSPRPSRSARSTSSTSGRCRQMRPTPWRGR